VFPNTGARICLARGEGKGKHRDMSQLAQIISGPLLKLRGALDRFIAHADDINGQQNRQRIRNEGTGGAAQQNEKNTLKLEELKAEVSGHVDQLMNHVADHLKDSVQPDAPRMRCKMLVTHVERFMEGDQVIGEKINCMAVGGDKVQKEGYPSDGIDEDNDFARFSPSGSFEVYCVNPALIGTIKEGERYYVDFTLANGVPVATNGPDTAPDNSATQSGSTTGNTAVESGGLTTAEPDTKGSSGQVDTNPA